MLLQCDTTGPAPDRDAGNSSDLDRTLDTLGYYVHVTCRKRRRQPQVPQAYLQLPGVVTLKLTDIHRGRGQDFPVIPVICIPAFFATPFTQRRVTRFINEGKIVFKDITVVANEIIRVIETMACSNCVCI